MKKPQNGSPLLRLIKSEKAKVEQRNKKQEKPKEKTNKYGAKIVSIDDKTFASKREAERYIELKWLEKAGLIRGLVCHPSYELVVSGTRVGKYTADFEYLDTVSHKIIIEDVKGKMTEAASLRIRLFNALYNTEVRIIK